MPPNAIKDESILGKKEIILVLNEFEYPSVFFVNKQYF